MPIPHSVTITLPDWVPAHVAAWPIITTDTDRMRLVIGLAQENVDRSTGGPFGAAVFERKSGQLIAVGVNSVTSQANSVLHAEVMALMLAQKRIGRFSLAADGPGHELVTSCAPCAMCLGAILWSGAQRIVCGAAKEDAQRIAFDEGPVFPESYDYLRERGIEIVHDILRDEAKAVLDRYHAAGGPIYNG